MKRFALLTVPLDSNHAIPSYGLCGDFGERRVSFLAVKVPVPSLSHFNASGSKRTSTCTVRSLFLIIVGIATVKRNLRIFFVVHSIMTSTISSCQQSFWSWDIFVFDLSMTNLILQTHFNLPPNLTQRHQVHSLPQTVQLTASQASSGCLD